MTETETAGSDSPREGTGAPEWALVLALHCDDLRAPVVRLALDEYQTVEIGRGAERAIERTPPRLRIQLDDRAVSQTHARLVRMVGAWRVEDAGSKNGTRVNGGAIESRELVDGDVLECGGTFFVLRQAPGPVRDLGAPAAVTPLLGTLSPAFERELAVLPRIARSRIPVLLRGESGTGKEVLAEAVHALSGRAGAFVPVNCGAIPETLVESELFGSRRGAYSGAEDRPGLVRAAERGTLFLDEIAELPATSQAALLRVLQDGEVSPLGADRPVRVDVRIVAATHQPLEDRVTAGGFRRDLLARLRGYELRLPPLRARIEDLGLLCANLLARIEPGRPRQLSRAAGRALMLHPWPYNVRELEQVLRAAAAVASGPEIGVEDLRLTEARSATPIGDERQRLVALLEQHGGNLSAVARALATSRTQVARLLARHALDADAYKRR